MQLHVGWFSRCGIVVSWSVNCRWFWQHVWYRYLRSFCTRKFWPAKCNQRYVVGSYQPERHFAEQVCFALLFLFSSYLLAFRSPLNVIIDHSRFSSLFNSGFLSILLRRSSIVYFFSQYIITLITSSCWWNQYICLTVQDNFMQRNDAFNVFFTYYQNYYY